MTVINTCIHHTCFINISNNSRVSLLLVHLTFIIIFSITLAYYLLLLTVRLAKEISTKTKSLFLNCVWKFKNSTYRYHAQLAKRNTFVGPALQWRL